MKRFTSFIKTTLIGGLFFIIPIVLLVYLIGKVIGIFRKMVAPIADKIDFSLLGGEMTSRIIATIVLLLLCFCLVICQNKNSQPIERMGRR